MKVNAIIEAVIGEIDKISACDGHLFRVKLGLEGSDRGAEGGNQHGVAGLVKPGGVVEPEQIVKVRGW